MSLHITIDSIPESRILNWKKLVKEQLDLTDPTFELPICDEYESEEEDEDDESESEEEDEESAISSQDEELEALKRRFSKYLGKKGGTSIDVGSYDSTDPFIDDSEINAPAFLQAKSSKNTTNYPNEMSNPLLGEDEDFGGEIDEEKLNFRVIDTSHLMVEQQAAVKRKKMEASHGGGANLSNSASSSNASSSSGKKTATKKAKKSESSTGTIKSSKKSNSTSSNAPTNSKTTNPTLDSTVENSNAPNVDSNSVSSSNVPSSNATANSKPKIDFEREIAQFNLKVAKKTFASIASEKSFTDKTKFPSSLQIPLWNVVKWSILASSQRQFDLSTLFTEFLQEFLPFSQGAIRKLLFKVIGPTMLKNMQQEQEKNIQILREKLREKAAKQKKQPQESSQESSTQPTASSSSASKKKEPPNSSSLVMNSLGESERNLLYSCIQDAFDTFCCEQAFKSAQGENAADESSFRKQYFADLLNQLEGMISMASITGSYAASKRKMLKTLKGKFESEGESEANESQSVK